MKRTKKFPPELLNATNRERREYFEEYKISHRRLREVHEELLELIADLGPGKLIFVIGPAGVGKTTLRAGVERKLTADMLSELERDFRRIPVISLRTVASDTHSFSWKDLYKRILRAGDEPCVDRKTIP